MQKLQEYYRQFETCREHDIPMCADECPFKVDILNIQDRIVTGRLNAAYKSLRDSVVFPGIVARLCPAYCQEACIRRLVDTPVQIKEIERAIIANAKKKEPNRYNLPARKQRIGVIGAGLSGMGFAFRMAAKKYSVTVMEKSDKIGGCLSHLMEEAEYMAEFDMQFKNEKYSLRTGCAVDDIQPLCKRETAETASDGEDGQETFDVIYIATGAGGQTFGVPLPHSGSGNSGGCMLIGGTAVFLGGEVCGRDLMHGLADGLNIAVCAENFLKTKQLEYPVKPERTRCVPHVESLTEVPRTDVAKDHMTETECMTEAERCIRCRCDACARECDLVDYYKKMPVKMRDEIFLSCKPSGSLVHKSPARKYVAACTMCDMMTESCPEHIELCGMIKYARHKMREVDKVPEAYRQYFIRDMAFANGEYAALKKSMGKGGRYAFFPGCNLGALDPEYVIRPYKWLLEKHPDTGLLLRCCSVPLDWDGNTQLHEEEIAALRTDWEDMGRPVLIMACMSCQKHINEYIPEAETVSLYELLEEWGFEGAESSQAHEKFAVFDPCSARNRKDVQKAVRSLADRSGAALEELPEGDRHGCCGFGGMGSVAAPEFSEYVAKRRMEISETPYIVYCSNCRDIFCDRGKKAVHILDLLFDIDPRASRPQPDATGRRLNRVMLKKRLLEEIFKEETDMEPYESKYKLIMTDEVRQKVNRQKLLEEDICEVISNAENTGRKTLDPETGHFTAYREIGYITCWVEYSPLADGFEIHNTYTHRMKIELEAVWNGKKTDTDM